MKPVQLIDLTRHLALMARLGYPLAEGLAMATDRPELIESIRRGDSPGQALRRWPRIFSPFYREMVEAADSSPRAAEILSDLSRWLERQESLRLALAGALAYPLLTLNLLLLQVSLLFWLAPMNLGLGPFAHWLSLAALVGFALTLLPAGLDYVSGLLPGTRRLRRLIEESLWCRALGVLLGTGLDLPRALELCGSLVARHASLAEKVRSGSSLATALQPANPTVIWAAEAAERTEEPAAALLFAADQLEQQADDLRERIIRSAEPLATLAVGVLVALVLTSFWSAFYGSV
ncbi:MAG: hypothetical protein AMXMBFR33_05090 [Candidatus Xenobia bacterium]